MLQLQQQQQKYCCLMKWWASHLLFENLAKGHQKVPGERSKPLIYNNSISAVYNNCHQQISVLVYHAQILLLCIANATMFSCPFSKFKCKSS